jgi:uncharacterized lipoprotein YddW (UPF0748 family)
VSAFTLTLKPVLGILQLLNKHTVLIINTLLFCFFFPSPAVAQLPPVADSDGSRFFIETAAPIVLTDSFPMIEMSQNVAKKKFGVRVAQHESGKQEALVGSPDKEFRAIWVSTIQRVDFPAKETTNPAALKKEWLQLLQFYKSLNINAVIVQVRPCADAIYPSKLVPFSKFITGKSGKGLDNNFDLLQFMVETSHAAKMEFHAWINPFRALIDSDTVNLAPNHVFKAHRDWVYKYGKEYQLNPGIPEVRQHFLEVIAELTANYDINAIHFDDYYYPYRVLNEEIDDSLTFVKYGKNFKNIKDWRRNNINLVMESVYKKVKSIDTTVQVGVSPFAVWRNKETDKNGSDTKGGQQCYDDLYADVLKWLKSDWVDYIAPEVYFHIGHPQVDFKKSVQWWLKNRYGKKMYIGLALYKINNTKYPEWAEPDQIPNQIDFLRQFPDIKGYMLFSSKQLIENRLGVTDILKYQYFNDSRMASKAGALVPHTMPKKKSPPAAAPSKTLPSETLGASKKKVRS